MENRRRIVGLLGLVSALLLSGSWPAGTRSASVGASPSPVVQPQGEGPWVVRAYYTDRQMVYDLAAWLEPWEVHHDEGYVVVAVGPAEYDRMLAAGFELEIEPRLTDKLNRPAVMLPGQVQGIPGYPCYRTVEETFAVAQDIAGEHPHLAAWLDIGDSWEKALSSGDPGYDMMVLRLTNLAVVGPKPKLFIMSSVHAREYAPAELSTRFAEYLVDHYNSDPDVTWLLDYHEIHLLLQGNPDGRKIAEQGYYQRKNTNDSNGGSCSVPPTAFDHYGTDLNRNFAFQWGCCGGSSSDPCDELFRGPSAASEPETQTIQDYLRAQFPDQRDDGLSVPAPPDATGLFLDVHSYGELVLWPWGFTSAQAPNNAALQTLGRKLAYLNACYPEQAEGLYRTDGTTDDFAYGDLGLAAYTFEIGTDFFQDCGAFENSIVPGNLPALLYAAKVARTPYLMPAGPDALDLAVEAGLVAPGEPVRLTATIDDTRYSGSNGLEPTQIIVAAECYVDVPPWITTPAPIPYPMAAVDGSFDEKVEQVAVTVDTHGLSDGRHTLYVRGRDADGNWGPFSAVFAHVLDPAASPLIEGYVRDASTNAPLAATVTAGTFQAQTDAATGFYGMAVLSGTYELSATAMGYDPSTIGGVAAHDRETVRHSFYLSPICGPDVLSDGVEAGNPGWTADAPWAITTEASHSPSHSWSDSPGGSYSRDLDVSLTSPVFDLSGYQNLRLDFWHTYDIEPHPNPDPGYRYDYGSVEYSTDGGSSWTEAAFYDGYGHTTWTREEMAMIALDRQPRVQIRFRLHSDEWTEGDGWHIDDIGLTGDGPACVSPFAPSAEFTSTSPVFLGQPMAFTNMISGTPPFDYRWNFGDAVGTSTDSDPAYTYLSSGTFSVTLVVTNGLGSDDASHEVLVQPAFYVYLPVVVKDG
jgi:carboxypeptidase T